MTPQNQSRLFRISLTLQRFALSVWVGAAALFVVTSVAEQTSEHFDSMTRDLLATIRFPLYYKFGFITHIVAAGLGFLAWRAAMDGARRRMFAILALVMLSGFLMALDFRFVYQPLQEAIIPPGRVRNAEFVQLHNWSRYANQTHVSVLMVAALLSCWPVSDAVVGRSPSA